MTVAQQTYYLPNDKPLSSMSYLTDQQMEILKNLKLSHLFSGQRCKDVSYNKIEKQVYKGVGVRVR